MNRLVERGLVRPSAAQRWNQADRPGQRRSLIAQDIAKHVAGENHVKLRGPEKNLHRGVVDVEVVQLHARVFARDRETVSRQSVELARTFALSTLVK